MTDRRKRTILLKCKENTRYLDKKSTSYDIKNTPVLGNIVIKQQKIQESYFNNLTIKRLSLNKKASEKLPFISSPSYLKGNFTVNKHKKKDKLLNLTKDENHLEKFKNTKIYSITTKINNNLTDETTQFISNDSISTSMKLTLNNNMKYQNIPSLKCNLKKVYYNNQEKNKSIQSIEKKPIKLKNFLSENFKNNNNNKINLHNLYNTLQKNRDLRLKYCTFPGNNSKLIDKIMSYREDTWEKVPLNCSKFSDFVWSPLAHSINFKITQEIHQCVNHIEFNCEIANKMRLYTNLMRFCEKKNIDLFQIFPFTICLQLSHNSFEKQLDNFKDLFNNIDKYTPKSKTEFGEFFNLFLYRLIGNLQTINIPESFNSGKNLWILKPINLNRGRCIKVYNNLNNIIKDLKEIRSNKNIINEEIDSNKSSFKCEYIMIQKYLEKPLLYQGRKFDIRIWVLFITSQDKFVYIFKQGHLKATCCPYNPDSDDLYVHLTNCSVQKHNQKFSQIEIGNEIPFYDLQEELNKSNTGIDFMKDIYPKICWIVRVTAGAAKNKMNFLQKKNCFEIFGYDFILDEIYQPYLLEINSNPGLEISSPLINELLPRMIDDAFKLTIDVEFPASNKYINKESNFPVYKYKNSENMWDKYTIL